MARSLVYITFGDTYDPSDKSAFNNALLCVRQQFMAAAEKIKTNPSAIEEYLRIDTGLELKIDAPTKPNVEVATESKPVATPAVATETDLIDKIFNKLKRTQKSQKIMEVFVQNPGSELSIQDIQNATGLLYIDVSSWLSTTGKSLAYISRPSRGKYKFNPDHLQ